MLRDGFEQNVEIRNIKANPIKRELMGQLIELKIKEMSLEAKIASIKSILVDIEVQIQPNSSQGNLFHLIKKREPLISNIDILNEKIIETEMLMKDIACSFMLIEPPQIPGSANCKGIQFYLAVGLLLGLVLAIGLIVLYDFLDDRIKLISDIQNHFDFPILGAIHAYNKLKETDSLKSLSISEIYNEFDNELTEIRINIKQLTNTKEDKIFSIVSPNREDGKSFISYILAHELAQRSEKVLLIDFDSLLPRLSKIFQMKKQKGLQDYLFDEASFEEIISGTELKNLDFVPIGENPLKVKIQYDSEKVQQFLAKAKEKYDIILIDTPALNPHPQIFDLIKQSSKLILALRLNKTNRRNIKSTLEKIKTIKSKLIGSIVTEVKYVPLGSYYENYSKYNKYYKDYKKSK
jgi:succinoglycan biosynthesis transport protein ExoP